MLCNLLWVKYLVTRHLVNVRLHETEDDVNCEDSINEQVNSCKEWLFT